MSIKENQTTAASQIYDMYCDALTNETQTYWLEDVAEMRQEREELNDEIADLNVKIGDATDEGEVDSLRGERNSLIPTLEDMDKVLGFMEGSPNNGNLLMRRHRSVEWHDMEPVMYFADPDEAAEACAVFNTHDIISGLPKV